jgi:hypothetical protein
LVTNQAIVNAMDAAAINGTGTGTTIREFERGGVNVVATAQMVMHLHGYDRGC